MKHSSSINYVGIIIWLIIIGVILWLVHAQNNFVLTKYYIYGDSTLPKSFVGYKIVHISDICNSSLDIEKQVKKAEPDIIIVTGGYQDTAGNSTNTVKTINELAQIAPVYYIYNTSDNNTVLSGTSATDITDNVVKKSPNNKDATTFLKDNYNMEINSNNEDEVEYLNYVTEQLTETAGAELAIIGIGNYDYDNGVYDATDKLYSMLEDSEGDTTLLLIGNTNYLDNLTKTETDMAFFGGTFGATKVLDKYTKGIYGLNGTQLFVSGGIGNNGTVKRIFNFPEIQVITLSDGTITEKNPLEEFISKFYTNVGTIFDNDGGFHRYTYRYGSTN
jgi:hypothetical protein